MHEQETDTDFFGEEAKLEQIKQLVERAYVNPGLEYDSLRRIGDLVGAKGAFDAA